MSAKLEQVEGLKHQLEVIVSADEVASAFQKRLNEFASQAKLKGFRPGKVPVSVVEQKYGKGLLQEVAAKLIEKSFDAAVSEQSIKVAGLPDIDFDHQTLKKNESISYIAKFEIYPEISLVDLSDVEIESVSGQVSEEDVAGMLIKLRTQHADWEEVSREAKLGDRLTIDFDGVIDGEPLENGSAKNTPLELGSKSMIPGFEEGLIGAKAGETTELDISFPEEYHVEDLRAKPVKFTVTVHKIESPKLPPLDDEFAKKVGVDSGGVDALKAKVKESMQGELDNIVKGKLKQAALDKLFEKNPIDVPSALIDNEIKNLQEMTRQQIRNMQRQAGNHQISEKDIQNIPLGRDPYVEEATKRVVLGLLLAEVIKKSEIKADQDKVLEKVREIASSYPNPDEVYNFYAKNNRMLSEIEALVLEEAAVDALLAKASLKNVEKSYDAIIQLNDAADQ